MTKTVSEVMSKRERYPVRVNVNNKYSHTFKLDKAPELDKPKRSSRGSSPLDSARKMGAKV